MTVRVLHDNVVMAYIVRMRQVLRPREKKLGLGRRHAENLFCAVCIQC